MSAYIIVSYDIVDPEAYADYVAGVIPLLQKHGGEVVVADMDAQALEGEKKSVYVVLRFASKEAALGWYNDPEYVPVRQVRFDSCANSNIALAGEFVPAEA